MTTPSPPSHALSGRVRQWLMTLVTSGGSDLHLVAGHPPVQRLHGELIAFDEPPLTPDEADTLIRSFCPPEALAGLQNRKDYDFSFVAPLDVGPARFRANLFHTDRNLAACLRLVPSTIPDLSWAGLSTDLAKQLAFLRDGLVILTGATGSGKTTTLAMIVNLINQAGGYRIITVEEPVEYIFPPAANSLVTQREVGSDVASFADGLKYGLRQDPDVVLVGEIRDRETAQMALSAAETGHLVFTTLHTRDAKGAITRFSDLFPQDAQREVRILLALSLRAIISQRLLPGINIGTKRHLALEILWNSNPISSAIRNNRIETIDNYMLMNRDEGMVSFDESVRLLLKAGKITRQIAEHNVRDVALLNR